MSKSIMIVICDFLLLSLLSLANFDSPPSEDAALKAQQEIAEQQRSQQAFADAQMLDLLKMSLDSERDRRQSLDSDISKLAQTAEEHKKLAERQRKILESRELELERLAKTKAELEGERERILNKSRELQSRVDSAEKRNEKLQNEIVSAGERLEKSARERLELERKLGDMRQADSSSKQKLEAAQEELRRNKQKLEELRAEGESLKSENRAIENEKRALATRLEIASAKTQIYEENIKRYRVLVDIEKTEKEKIREHAETLAVGVGELAAQQKNLSETVRDLRPKTSSEIFQSVKNRFVSVVFDYTRNGLFGDGKTNAEFRALPVKFAGKVWLVFRAPSVVAPSAKDKYFAPDSLSVSVRGKGFKFSPVSLSSIAEDPRLLALEVPQTFLEKEKIEPLEIPQNFFAYSDCAVVDPEKFHYGLVPFRADFKNNAYAKLDVGLIESVFGTFSPSDGDVVLSRNGEYMGSMLGGSLAVLLQSITPAKNLPVGAAYSTAVADAFVKTNSARLEKIPFSLR